MKELVLESTIDFARLHAAFAERYETFLLDDSGPRRGRRLAILGVDPRAHYRWHRGEGWMEEGGARGRIDDPFDALRRLHAGLPFARGPEDVPFTGGLLGYLGYDAGRAVEVVPDENPPDSSLPDLAFARYDLVVVHEDGAPLRIFAGADDAEERHALARSVIADAADRPPVVPFVAGSRRPAVSGHAPEEYRAAIEEIREAIRDGEVYQVNLTQRFLAACEAEPLALFEALRLRHPAAYGAAFRERGAWVLSSSPECYLEVDGRRARTRPIKGTAPRHPDPVEDARCADALARSEKDRAELAMIVDLVRNDLSRVCRPGSVVVPEHAALEPVPTVHHLVSTVEGELEPDRDVFDLLRAAHPAGSITGAPKIAAMEVIDRLERTRRGVYTGGIGYVGRDGRAAFNVAIRTVVLEAGWARVQGGGGIVIDSEAGSEYDESVAKIRGLLEVIGAEVRT
ncbi:MAG: aminodeoxychorismate synthase component I [Planctomycetota bacterium]